MIKEKNRKALRYIIYIPIVLLIFILQATVFTHFQIFGVKPLIFPLMVAGIGLFEGKVHGTALGLICGVLCDVSFNQPAIMFTMTLTLIGLFVGLLGDMVLSNAFVSYVGCSAASLVICVLVQMIYLTFTAGVPLGAMMTTAVMQTLVSLLFTVPCWYFALLINRTLRD